MKFQILFPGKNKKNITNLSSAEIAQRVEKIKGTLDSDTYESLHDKIPL